MKKETFIDAVGMIDEKYVEESEKPVKRISVLFRALSFAAASLVFVSTLPTAVVCGSDTAYSIMYELLPPAAQRLKPVMKSCTDNGIKIEVISAETEGRRAEIVVAVNDTEGNRIDSTTDLFDSYSINCPYDSSCSCSMAGFDAGTSTAFFHINIERMDGKDIRNDKITFGVRRMMAGKNKYSGILDEIDLNNISASPKTMNTDQNNVRGGSSRGNIDIFEIDYKNFRFLVPDDTISFSPVDGVRVTGIGYIDGALRIQTYYEDIHNTDNHGYLYLADSDGNAADYEEYDISFWDDERKGSYDEKVIEIPYDKIKNYQIYGEFVTCSTLIEGDWEITFPVK